MTKNKVTLYLFFAILFSLVPWTRVKLLFQRVVCELSEQRAKISFENWRVSLLTVNYVRRLLTNISGRSLWEISWYFTQNWSPKSKKNLLKIGFLYMQSNKPTVKDVTQHTALLKAPLDWSYFEVLKFSGNAD